jgi:hypothetical protein
MERDHATNEGLTTALANIQAASVATISEQADVAACKRV